MICEPVELFLLLGSLLLFQLFERGGEGFRQRKRAQVVQHRRVYILYWLIYNFYTKIYFLLFVFTTLRFSISITSHLCYIGRRIIIIGSGSRICVLLLCLVLEAQARAGPLEGVLFLVLLLHDPVALSCSSEPFFSLPHDLRLAVRGEDWVGVETHQFLRGHRADVGHFPDKPRILATRLEIIFTLQTLTRRLSFSVEPRPLSQLLARLLYAWILVAVRGIVARRGRAAAASREVELFFTLPKKSRFSF
mmetsp:Transcript_25915/g.65314  ORF Transcript_25915/g.65314 Transcript_25915/m.65314 type:complete len:249 (+) Transcript_25915:650-1396(+)